MQRFIEIWSSMPELYILIIFSSLFEPSIFLLIILLSLFGWMSLSDYVRAEFLKGRNMEYVVAARTLGLSNTKIILKHILPNSMVSVITFLPFRISGAILILTSLDFLGLGVPPDTPSLGELLAQGKENIDCPYKLEEIDEAILILKNRITVIPEDMHSYYLNQYSNPINSNT